MQTQGAADLIVRFVGGPPDEEVLRFAQRCAARARLPIPVTLVLHWNDDKVSVRDVHIESAGQVLLSEAEPDLLLAVRNAFARAAMTMPAQAAQRRS